MRILIIGGTRFVGRHIASAAIAAGHDVTLLHRGKTGVDLFPEATHVLADRNEDLAGLGGQTWEATIDVSAYFPRQVDSLAEALGGRGGQYVYISSVSVYDVPAHAEYAEDSPVRRLDEGPIPTTITPENYGPLKALCEQAAFDHFGQSTAIVRPTYVIGPHDHSGRFTYWVHRIARGGEVLAPGKSDSAIQVIDARDLAGFVLALVQANRPGVFHTVTPWMGFGELLGAIEREVAPPGTSLTWVDPEFLLSEGESAGTLPLWDAGDEDDALVNTASPAAALDAGLVLRPLAESIRDTYAVEPAPDHLTYMKPAREAELLARWRNKSD